MTNVRYCHRVAGAFGTQCLTTVATVMLHTQSTAEFHLEMLTIKQITDKLEHNQKLTASCNDWLPTFVKKKK